MKIENQVCSLELAKKLKELGFEQESLFIYFYDGDGWSIRDWNEPIPANIAEKNYDFIYSAYTVAELGEMLPMFLTAEQMGNAPEYGEMYLEMWHDSYGWALTYRNDNEQSVLEEPIREKTEADGRATMLIYLKENNLI